jgi:hypothetical protein
MPGHELDTELVLKLFPHLMTAAAVIDFVRHVFMSISGGTTFCKIGKCPENLVFLVPEADSPNIDKS